jgi:hypothetical protein
MSKFQWKCAANRASVEERGLAIMKLQFLLVSAVAIGLSASAPEAVAHGGFGGGGGGGGGHGGGGFHGGGFHGGGRFGGFRGGRFGAFRGGRFGNFHGHGRFFGPGFGFYGYPWWWDWGYPYYPYYYPGPYYGYDGYYGNPYYGNQYYGSPYYGNQYYGSPSDRTGEARSSPTKAVQAALAQRGYYRGPINGVLSPESRSAIRSFQARNGLPVTGRIDGDLVRALRS